VRFLKLVYLAWRACRRKGPEDVIFVSLASRGVPQVTMLIGFDREAWRVSQIAIESSALRA
jgi:hypothetical protein